MPGMLLYSAGKQYMDAIFPKDKEKDIYLSPVIDMAIINRTGGTTSDEVAHRILLNVNLNRKWLKEKLNVDFGDMSPERIAKRILQDGELAQIFFGENMNKAFDYALTIRDLPQDEIDRLFDEQESKATLEVIKEIVKDKDGSLVVDTPEWKLKVVEGYYSFLANKQLGAHIIGILNSEVSKTSSSNQSSS
ncbi:MAG: hypothetical protein WCK31_00430 [bacterium]